MMSNQTTLDGRPPTPPPISGSGSTTRGILIGVTGTVVLLAAYFALAYLQGLWPFEQLMDAGEDITTDWEIYRDSRTGFEFQYPSSIGPLTEEVSTYGALPPYVLISGEGVLNTIVMINNPGTGGKGIYKPTTHSVEAGDQIITYQKGQFVPMDDTNAPLDEILWRAAFDMGGSSYFIEFSSPDGTDMTELIEKILTTIRFTEPKVITSQEPTTYKLTCSGYGTDALNAWGSPYSWFEYFRSHIAPGWVVSSACLNEETNQVAYLKQRHGTPPITNQLGIYHIERFYYSKAPMHQVEVVYGACREITDWSTDELGTSTILYTCFGGDAGTTGTNTYQYFVSNGLLRRIRECTTRDVDESCNVVDKTIARIEPYCLSTSIPREIGDSVYESAPSFSHLEPNLASILTASVCGPDRFEEVTGGSQKIFTLGISLDLKSTDNGILEDLRTAGFAPSVSCNGDTDDTCLQWQKPEPTPILHLLFLRDWVNQIRSSECIHCG